MTGKTGARALLLCSLREPGESGKANELLGIFEQYLHTRNAFFLRLSVCFGVKLYERESVIIFDEVQLYPKARAAIKYLVADGRYDYIETGSLVSLRRNVKDIVIPSEEESIDMFPMDFEEFLWAMNEEMLVDFIRSQYESLSPMGSLHRKAYDPINIRQSENTEETVFGVVGLLTIISSQACTGDNSEIVRSLPIIDHL